MSKLLKLKKWLTVEDAAKRLSISVGEDVTEADILRLALDGHLTLSVYFVNHAKGRPVRIELLSSQHFSNAPSLFEYGPPRCVSIDGAVLPNKKEVLIYEGDEQKPECLEGVWDLLMLGAEKLDVEHAYQSLTGGPAVDLTCFGGPLVASADRSQIFQILSYYKCSTRLQESIKPKVSKAAREAIDRLNAMIGPVTASPPEQAEPSLWDYETVFYPARGLPDDSTFVVRTAALRELEAKLLADEVQPEKPLHPSERKSAGQIIATLAAMAKLDLCVPYTADEVLRKAAATHGLELPGSPETVVKFLKWAADGAGKA